MAQFTNDSMGQSGWNATDFKMRILNDYAKIAYSLTASHGIVGNLMVIVVIAKSAHNIIVSLWRETSSLHRGITLTCFNTAIILFCYYLSI